VSRRRVQVFITANFERNLTQIREFLASAGADTAFEALVDRLESQWIPNLERFPDLGADFLARAPLSRDGQALFERLVEAVGASADVRQLIEGDYIVLYLVRPGSLYLLSIRHHRQLSFDLAGHWP
jgi:hypothetical protein